MEMEQARRSPITQRAALADQSPDLAISSLSTNVTADLNLIQNSNNALAPGDPDHTSTERFTGPKHSRRLRRMRRNRRKLILEQQRMASSDSDSGSMDGNDDKDTNEAAGSMDGNNDKDTNEADEQPNSSQSDGLMSSTSGTATQPAPRLALNVSAPVGHEVVEFTPSDEERISSAVEHFVFGSDSDCEQSGNSTDAGAEADVDTKSTSTTSENADRSSSPMNFSNLVCKSEDELEYGLVVDIDEDIETTPEESKSAVIIEPEPEPVIELDTTDKVKEGSQLEIARMRGQQQPLPLMASINNDFPYKGILAKNYRIYTTNAIQFANRPVTFFIEPQPTYGHFTIPFQPQHFAIMVTSPKNNLQFPVHIDDDDYLLESKEVGEFGGPFYQKRFKCHFEPEEPGLYPITVSLSTYGHVWDPQHVGGSPLNVTVKEDLLNDFSSKNACLGAIGFGLQKLVVNEYGHPKTPGSTLTPRTSALKKSPTKRHGPRLDSKNSNVSPPKMAKSGTMREVTTCNGMFYYNHRPVTVTTTPPSLPDSAKGKKTKPWGITYCPKTDEVLVAARDLHLVQRYSATTGQYLGKFGTLGNAPGFFFRPTGIVYDATHERLLITDKDNHRVCFYTPEGKFISCFGSDGHFDGGLHYPWGLDVTKDGSLIVVADSRNHRIQIFTSTGEFVRKYSVFETNPFEYKEIFNYPRGVCFDNSGKFIFVSDFNTNSVFMLDIGCTTQLPISTRGQCLRPQGLAINSDGNVIICDTRHNCLRMIDLNGKQVSTVEGFGRGGGKDRGGEGATCAGAITGDFEKQDVPIDVCLVKDGKLAVLNGLGVVRIF